jgi:hypothetical protein
VCKQKVLVCLDKANTYVHTMGAALEGGGRSCPAKVCCADERAHLGSAHACANTPYIDTDSGAETSGVRPRSQRQSEPATLPGSAGVWGSRSAHSPSASHQKTGAADLRPDPRRPQAAPHAAEHQVDSQVGGGRACRGLRAVVCSVRRVCGGSDTRCTHRRRWRRRRPGACLAVWSGRPRFRGVPGGLLCRRPAGRPANSMDSWTGVQADSSTGSGGGAGAGAGERVGLGGHVDADVGRGTE